jgi:hypothetical protein
MSTSKAEALSKVKKPTRKTQSLRMASQGEHSFDSKLAHQKPQIVPKVPKKADFFRFFGKIGFIKSCPRCLRNPIFLEFFGKLLRFTLSRSARNESSTPLGLIIAVLAFLKLFL